MHEFTGHNRKLSPSEGGVVGKYSPPISLPCLFCTGSSLFIIKAEVPPAKPPTAERLPTRGQGARDADIHAMTLFPCLSRWLVNSKLSFASLSREGTPPSPDPSPQKAPESKKAMLHATSSLRFPLIWAILAETAATTPSNRRPGVSLWLVKSKLQLAGPGREEPPQTPRNARRLAVKISP